MPMESGTRLAHDENLFPIGMDCEFVDGSGSAAHASRQREVLPCDVDRM